MPKPNRSTRPTRADVRRLYSHIPLMGPDEFAALVDNIVASRHPEPMPDEELTAILSWCQGAFINGLLLDMLIAGGASVRWDAEHGDAVFWSDQGAALPGARS